MNKLDKFNMVPGFILKLWKMVNDPQCNDLISWSDNGTSFIIIDPPRFAQELSKYFKHNNLSSFIRQLNMYGFRKVATIENSGLHPGVDDLHFYHPEFIRGHKERLAGIKRKLPQKLAETIDLKNVYRGITEIEDRQKDVSKSLSDLRRENEMLWQELHDLRQKHQQQQLYISRLMKLVYEAMEQNGIKSNMLPLRHNPPLMIEGGEGATSAATGTTEQTGSTVTTSASSPIQDMMANADILQTIITDTIPQTLNSPVDPTATTTITTSPNTLLTPNTSLVDDVGAVVHPVMETTYHMEGIDGEKYVIESGNGGSGSLTGSPLNTPNNLLHSQVERNDFHLDNLVPSIIDFSDENLELFNE